MGNTSVRPEHNMGMGSMPVNSEVVPISIARRKNKTVNGVNGTYFIVCYFIVNPDTGEYTPVYKVVERLRLIEAIKNRSVVVVNGKLSKDNRLLFTVPTKLYKASVMVANAIRQYMEIKYGRNLAGRCVEASYLITSHMSLYGFIDTDEISGWCLYDNPMGCGKRPYGPHTWVEAHDKKNNIHLYIDVTADQFSRFMNEKYKSVYVGTKLPNKMVYSEPKR